MKSFITHIEEATVKSTLPADTIYSQKQPVGADEPQTGEEVGEGMHDLDQFIHSEAGEETVISKDAGADSDHHFDGRTSLEKK